MRLSIRYKILAVTGFLLLLAVGFYTLLASFIFVEQKTALLYEINHSVAVNSAAGIRSSLGQVAETLKLYAVSRLLASKSELQLPASGLKESFIEGIGLFALRDSRFEAVEFSEAIPKLSLSADALAPKLLSASKDHYAFWKENEGFFLATRLDLTMGKQLRSFVCVARLEGKHFLDSLMSATVFESFLTAKGGDVLVHLNDHRIASTEAIPDHPLLKNQEVAGSRTGVQSFDYQGAKRYGAFAPVGMSGLFFISQADEKEVTSALTVLLQRSLLFGLIVLTLTLIASILFSASLTKNLQNLARGVVAIGSGNLDSHIQVRSGDEVEALASSFNQMVDALRASREAIEKYNRELEDKVALRTKQLSETNATIKAVQEKLVQTSQLAAVGEVAGRTAHELLNPLTAILSRIERSRNTVNKKDEKESIPSQMFEILNAWKDEYSKGGFAGLTNSLGVASTVSPGKTLLDEDLTNLSQLAKFWQNEATIVSDDLDFVRDQAERIHRIVDKMRELIRSSDKGELACRSAVEEAAATMKDFLSKHGVKLHLEWNAQKDTAHLNRDELIQIITNLLRNAYQSIQGPGRNGEITLRALNQEETLHIEVEDNGSGISAENQSRLFEQGFTTKGPSEGTGLGLAICRRYARAFGGEVELKHSKIQEGTCFRIIIPLSSEREAAA
jgi:signal transduction histidine kinase